jgi:hypothetical protein
MTDALKLLLKKLLLKPCPPADEGADSLNASEVLILHTKLRIKNHFESRIILGVTAAYRQRHTFQVERESRLPY